MPSYEKIKHYAERSEQHHEKEPDDFIRAVLELAAHDVDDRHEPDEKEGRAHYDNRRGEAQSQIHYAMIDPGRHCPALRVKSGPPKVRSTFMPCPASCRSGTLPVVPVQ